MGEAAEALSRVREVVPPEVCAFIIEEYTSHGGVKAICRKVKLKFGAALDEGTVAGVVVRAGVTRDTVEKLTAQATAIMATLVQDKAILVASLLDDITELRAQLFSPAETHHWTRDGEFHSATLTRPTFADQKQIVIAIAVLIDKVQLLTGEATARTELLSNPDVRGKAESVIDELAKRRESA